MASRNNTAPTGAPSPHRLELLGALEGGAVHHCAADFEPETLGAHAIAAPAPLVLVQWVHYNALCLQ